jgi:periplasmic mercuric ion binding protein
VTYNSKKITLEQIHQKVANVGHDTDLVKASDEAYKKIAACCKYREGATCDHEH